MKKFILAILLVLSLSACGGGVGVKNSFPDLPPKLMDPPKEMQTLVADDSKIDPKDESDSGIAMSTVLKITTFNFGVCNQNKTQLLDLQSWVKEQKALNP